MDFQEVKAFAKEALSVRNSAHPADQVLLSLVLMLEREMTRNKE